MKVQLYRHTTCIPSWNDVEMENPYFDLKKKILWKNYQYLKLKAF